MNIYVHMKHVENYFSGHPIQKHPMQIRQTELLLQQYGGPGHEGDPSPVPDEDDEDAGGEEGLHGKPDLGEASVLVDALQKQRVNIS